MKSNSRLIRFAVLSLVIVAIPMASFASHSWGSYHWKKTGGSVPLVLNDNVSGVWDTYLRNAEADWDGSSVLSLSVGPKGATTPRKCSPADGNVEVCNAAYGNNGWLGLAQIWLTGGHISKGAAKMNDSYFMYESEKLHVMCQEVGHVFGLGHTSEDGTSQNTCMDYYSNKSDSDMTSTKTNAHDMSMLSSIYNHTEPASFGVSIAMAPPAMGYIDFAGVGQWGQEIWRSKDGRGVVYFADFGLDHEDNPHGVLTHVYGVGEHNVPVEQEERPWLRPRTQE